MSSWLEDSTAGCAAASATASASRASGHTFTRPSEPPVTSAEWSAVRAMSQMVPSCSPTQVSVSRHDRAHARPPPVQKCSLRPAATARVFLDSGTLL